MGKKVTFKKKFKMCLDGRALLEKKKKMHHIAFEKVFIILH